ncbi:signal peptide protein [Pandoraea communis]|uniref:Signal peptide protein n=1 Tax=Pandoraea communis TaxID=2508297 RepID=A0A5E4V2A9_9BURK|nr:DUF1254 domain-containing protein [Pandoraea communis]VVE06412.1 signal peptide protein [Pandoraea communis]
MSNRLRHTFSVLAFLAGVSLFGLGAIGGAHAASLSHDEARAIAREATIYGFPLVDSYRIQYSYFVDRDNPEYKAPWNTLNNVARVFTPDDKAIQTPNSDTPYSFLGADLRAEPLVITVPAVEKDRYYSLQFIDMYTHNFAYVGSRATGNEAGSFLLAGPRWKGEAPKGLKGVIRSETDFDFVLYRTQLKNAADIEAVKAVQAGYKVQTLSQFLGKPSKTAPDVAFLKPLTAEEQRTSPEFFNLLNFVLQFCPTHASEIDLMARFAKLGIGGGKRFDLQALSPDIRQAVQEGMTDAWRDFAEFKKNEIDTGKRPSSDAFGTREFLKNDYMVRMSGAVLGIYGNSKGEALYPAYFTDVNGQPLDATRQRYTLRLAPGELPPANAFWSVTMYELPSSLLSANPLNRYLINSPMLPQLKKDADGGITLYLQHETPGKDKEANWLPAPKGPFWTVMRIYWPKPEALDGRWKSPVLELAK